MKKLDSADIRKLLNQPEKSPATKPVRGSSKGTALEVLHDITPEQRKHPLAKCECCPLFNEKSALSCGPNPDEAKVSFVSRSPGQYDVMAGKPFANPRGAGAVLNHLLARYGVSRQDVFTTNVVLCRTDDPPKEAIEACRPRLEAEIANSELVILGGTEATSALTRYKAVFTARPFVHRRTSISGVEQRLIVTNNPAIVVRDSDKYPDLVEDFRRAFDPPPPPVFPEVEIISGDDNCRSVLDRWMESLSDVSIASDLEWAGTHITCAGFALRSGKSVVLASFGEATLSSLKRFYERRDFRFIWHNGKADTKILKLNGIDANIDEDTFLQSYALDERPGYHSLEYLLSTKFGWPDYEPKSVKHFKKTGEFLGKTAQERKLSERELYKYNGWDTAGTYQLFSLLDPKLDTDNGGEVRTLYKRLLGAQTRFRTVELSGFHFDVEEACNVNEREAMPRIQELTEHIRDVTKHPLINPAAPQQLKAVLYSEWGLKHSLRDSGKRKLSVSTGKEVREEIVAGRFTSKPGTREQVVRWAEFQAQFSKISKLKGTYLEGLAIRTLQDGKLYCNFNPCGTVSGRTSSNDPNFQNIAREGYEEIPGIRTLFLPSPGNVILSADFSQAELRTCAKLSGDANFLGIYRDSSRSLHKERAAAFYGENYTKEQYVKSKNINFGVTYGQSASAFAQMYHMDQDEAQQYINSWWAEFPDLFEWTKDQKARAKKDGFIISPFGHKRRFHLITDENIGDVEREAVNFLPQNIAAWATISAICDLVDLGVRVIATVHDSIVADVPADSVDHYASIMKEVMESQVEKQLGWTDIPFLVDISYGKNWGEQQEIELGVAA